MPEGDTIFRIAATLRPLVAGRVIERSDGNGRAPFDPQRLVGRPAERVEARGKHLLLHLDDRHVVHSHLGMTGSWHVYEAGQAWRKPRPRAWLVLGFEGFEVVCFTPKILELLTGDELRRHPLLRRLGPDLLDPDCDEDEILERLRRSPRLPIGEALLQQQFVAGIGNVYKSEVLFLERVDPFAALGDLDDDAIRRVIGTARRLALRNLEGKPRRTRFRSDGGRKWVYDRGGEPCFECATPIRMRRQGDMGRSTYWCPSCQAVPSAGTGGV